MRVGSGSHRYEVAEPWPLGLESSPSPDVAGVAVNSRDEVHVLTRSQHPVKVFDRHGRLLRTWGEGVFRTTHGIHIGPDDCVYIVDSGDSTVRRFSPDGELLFTLGSPDARSDTGYRDSDYRTISRGAAPFNAPTWVAVAPTTNEVYVSDGYGNARVHRFTEDGQLIDSWGRPGRGPGEFHIPHGVFIDRHGTVYIADRENERVQRFTLDGTFIDEWTDVRRPDTVVVTDDDRVYVAELGFVAGLVPGMPMPGPASPPSRVTIRDLDGTVRSTLGAADAEESACAPGNFFGAHGIAVDRHGSVYVGEVIAAVGTRKEGDFGWVPRSCHALQVFHPV